MYVYIESEHNPEGSLYTVGFYGPKGEWHPESDHDSQDKAAERVHWLNGGCQPENPFILHGESLKQAENALKNK